MKNKSFSLFLLLVISIATSAPVFFYISHFFEAGLGALTAIPLGFILTPILLFISIGGYKILIKQLGLPHVSTQFLMIPILFNIISANLILVFMFLSTFTGIGVYLFYNPNFTIEGKIVEVNYKGSRQPGEIQAAYKYAYEYKIVFPKNEQEKGMNKAFSVNLILDPTNQYSTITGGGTHTVIDAAIYEYNGSTPIGFDMLDRMGIKINPEQKVYIEVYMAGKYIDKSIYRLSNITNLDEIYEKDKIFNLENEKQN